MININRLTLCSKGVSILKDDLTIEEEKKIREDLQAKPFSPPNSIQCKQPFPIYRESKKKFYVPRFYAIKKYGSIHETSIPEADDIDISFTGDLREYQCNIINAYMKETTNSGCGLLEIPCGRGKTVMALNIISRLKKKTMVVVHKEFLMNQWIERIQQFLPNATIGRIQGQVIDVEGKDIVLCMLQSLSMKDYETSLFQGFGLTIIDECHHISAEVFSRSLFKLVTKYMLGLSATMDRKDKMTDVFKLFLGDVVYKEKREGDDDVTVRSIFYEVEDEEFSKVEYNFKGQTHYSIMIRKLCMFNPRTEFILKVLKDTILENDKQQIMILAHNKSLLKYLYDSIEHRNIGTVGYYVGGMKEKALKETETKQIIIATYAMAEEALDIKTLSALILATPKTDVTQAVGRILRMKHEQPLVIDIVDQHDIFKNQWIKRRRYYKKCNYIIQEIESPSYHTDYSKWRTYNKSNQKTNESEEKLKLKLKGTINCGKCLLKL